MARLVATRVSDEAYAKLMGKCACLGCSVYNYLKMLVETDTADTKQAKETEEKNKQFERARNATHEVTGLEEITEEDVEEILKSMVKSEGSART